MLKTCFVFKVGQNPVCRWRHSQHKRPQIEALHSKTVLTYPHLKLYVPFRMFKILLLFKSMLFNLNQQTPLKYYSIKTNRHFLAPFQCFYYVIRMNVLHIISNQSIVTGSGTYLIPNPGDDGFFERPSCFDRNTLPYLFPLSISHLSIRPNGLLHWYELLTELDSALKTKTV